MHAMELTNWVYMFLLSSIILSLYIFYTQWKLSRKHMYELAAKIPHPPQISLLPLIGHAHYFIGNTETILKQVMMASATPGIFSVWLAHRLFIVINTPEHMEIVLNSPKCLSKDNLYRMAEDMLGKGLFTSPVLPWKRHRKIIMPTFNQRILDGFVEVFSNQSDIFTDIIKQKGTEIFNIFPYVAKYSLDTVCETAMGIQIHAQLKDTVFEQNIARCMDIAMLRMFIVPLHSDFIYNLTPLAKEKKGKVKYVREFVNKFQVVVSKKAAYKEMLMNKNNYTIYEAEESKQKVFLECLIEASEDGANFTNDELIDEVATFMIAGSDTTATALAFTIQMLALHKDIEQRAYEEIMDILGPDHCVTYTDLPKMTYLEQVIKETMRLFPIGPFIVRRVDEDVEVGKYVLPQGAGLVLNIMSIHYSPAYYKDPMKFDPERFSPENITKRHRYAYLPFSAGPRNCIGAKYGMMSSKTLLANTVRKFRFETDYKSIQEIRLKQAIVIKAVDGFPVRAISRH